MGEEGAGGAEEALGVAYTWTEVCSSHRDRLNKVPNGIKKNGNEASAMFPRCFDVCLLVFNGSKLADLTMPRKGERRRRGLPTISLMTKRCGAFVLVTRNPRR